MKSNFKRFRTLRQHEALRNSLRETFLLPDHLMAPLFVMEGVGLKEEISTMPGYYRFSLDKVFDEIQELKSVGIRQLLLFVKVPDEKKDNMGKEALNVNGLMQKTIRAIKERFPEMILYSDVALDPYSIYGHDGIVENGEIINDESVEVLAKMALSHAEAGVDFVAPSDMMDGRIKAIRRKLDENGFQNRGILSYSAKYASSFYGPFRDALDSAPGFGDKKTYQMDFANSREGIAESLQDEAEGADVLMVKPGMPYLDILSKLYDSTRMPLAVYQVSGEYAMLKRAAESNAFNEKDAVLESLMSFRRAGAHIIATYYAKAAAQWLNED